MRGRKRTSAARAAVPATGARQLDAAGWRERCLEAEQRLDALFAHSPVGIAITRLPEHTFVSANPEFLRLFGFALAELVGKTSAEVGISTREDRNFVLTQLANSSAVRDLEVVRRTRSGEELRVELSVDRVQLGGVDCLMTTVVDVTERARVEAALRQTEGRLRQVIENSRDGINLLDLKTGKYVFMSRSQVELTGFTADELNDLSAEEALARVHPDDRHLSLEQQRSVAQGVDPGGAVTEYRWKVKSGEYRWFGDSRRLVRDERGEPVALVGNSRDITERKRNELEQRVLAKLGSTLLSLDNAAALQQLVHALVEELAELSVVYLAQPNGALEQAAVAASGKARAATRLPADDLVRQVWRERRPQLVTERKGVSRALAPLVGAGVCVGVLSVSSSSAHPLDARDLRLVEEVAWRLGLFLENVRLHEAEQRSISARDELLGIVAHDLRNPLNTIMLQSRLLRRADDAASTRAAEFIERASNRMGRIIQDLLDVTHFESGRFELISAEVSPAALVAELLETQGALAAARDLELRANVEPGLPQVWGERDRLLQVLENLVGNALKFTQHGSITVAAVRRDDSVRFSVADTGDGLAAEELPHLFDRFWQARKKTRSGAGLGLAIVKGIVEAHGGRAWVESTPRVGSTFFFTVPAARAPARLPPLDSKPPPARQGRVLVVDDDADTRETLASLLSSQGFEVGTAKNGHEAFGWIRQVWRPDAVVLDLAMPVVDGWEFLAARSADPELRSLPVVVVSGDLGVARQVAAASASYLPKPVNPDRLLEFLHEAVGA